MINVSPPNGVGRRKLLSLSLLRRKFLLRSQITSPQNGIQQIVLIHRSFIRGFQKAVRQQGRQEHKLFLCKSYANGRSITWIQTNTLQINHSFVERLWSWTRSLIVEQESKLCSMKKTHRVIASPRQSKKQRISCSLEKLSPGPKIVNRSCALGDPIIAHKEKKMQEGHKVSCSEVKIFLTPEMMIDVWGVGGKDGRQGFNVSRLRRPLRSEFLKIYKEIFHTCSVYRAPMYMARCFAAWKHGIDIDWDSVSEYAEECKKKLQDKQQDEQLLQQRDEKPKDDDLTMPSTLAAKFIQVLEDHLCILKGTAINEEACAYYESWRAALVELESVKANSKYIDEQIAILNTKLENVKVELEAKRKELEMQTKLVEKLGNGPRDSAELKLQYHEEADAKKKLESEVEKLHIDELGMSYMVNANMTSSITNDARMKEVEYEVKIKEELYCKEKNMNQQIICRKNRIESFRHAIQGGGSTLIIPQPSTPNENFTAIKLEVVACGFCGFSFKGLQYAAVISPCMHSFHLACAVYTFKLSKLCCLCTEEVSIAWLQSIGITTHDGGDELVHSHVELLDDARDELACSRTKLLDGARDAAKQSVATEAEMSPSATRQRIAWVVDSEEEWMSKLEQQKEGAELCMKSTIKSMNQFGQECGKLQDQLLENLQHEAFLEDESVQVYNMPSPEHETEQQVELPCRSPISLQEHDQPKSCNTPKGSNILHRTYERPSIAKKGSIAKQGPAKAKARRNLGLHEISVPTASEGDAETPKAKAKSSETQNADEPAHDTKSLNKLYKEEGKQSSPMDKRLIGSHIISGRSRQGSKKNQEAVKMRPIASPTKVVHNPAKSTPSARAEKKLLIIDVNRVFVKRFDVSERLPRRHQYSTVYQIGRFNVVARPGHLQFIKECFKHFAVAIWSTLAEQNLAKMLECLFPEDVRSQFEFIWCQTHCESTDLDHPHIPGRKIFLKDLQIIWSSMSYNSSNSLLVEDSEYKCLRNPYLKKAADSTNICAYVMRFPMIKSSTKETADVKKLLKNNKIL